MTVDARARRASEAPNLTQAFRRWAWRVNVAAAALIPLIVTSGADSFRLGKDVGLHAAGITIITLWAAASVLRIRMFDLTDWPKRTRWISASVIAWSAVTVVFATNYSLAIPAFVRVVLATVFFLSTAALARDRTLMSIVPLVVSGCINALVLFGQRSELWQPFDFHSLRGDVIGRLRLTALIGNPNDVGAFFVPVCIAALGMAVVTKSLRWLYVAIASLLAIGIFFSQTLTAISALMGGLLAASMLQRRLRAAAGAILAFLVIAALTYPPVRDRVSGKLQSLQSGHLNVLLDGRLTATLAGWRMFLGDPVTGVGPGCFGFNYFEAKLAAEHEYGSWLSFVNTVNFGEAHNDHIQVLAVTGVPGYLLFLAALLLLIRLSVSARAKDPTDLRRRFASFTSAPLAVSFAITALTSFPLELAAVLVPYLYLAALCSTWGEPLT